MQGVVVQLPAGLYALVFGFEEHLERPLHDYCMRV